MSHEAQTTTTDLRTRAMASRRRVPSPSSESGQTTAEYALVLIAAATIAMLIVAWAGSTGAINDFFETIIERITSMLP